MKAKLGKNNQQWIFDWLIKTTGKAQHWELDAMLDKLPGEVKSWAMIPKILNKQAQREEEMGRRAEKAGHIHTAWECYQRACQTYFNGQHTICESDNPQKIRMYEKFLACYEKVRQYNEYPIEKVEIPWGDKTIPGLLHIVPGAKKAPCVLHITGMDQSKEYFPHAVGIMIANPFLKRGMHCLSIDGPGQGEMLLRKVWTRPNNHNEAGKAAVDWLEKRPEVDASKIGFYGVSMGSYWGSHLAAYEPRIKASVVTMGCFFMNKHTIFDECSPRFRVTYRYMAGIEDDDEFEKLLPKLTLKGVGKNIKNPFLILNGEFDPLSPLEDAEAFFDEIAGPKEMWIMEDDFHTHFNRAMCNLPISALAGDWLKDKLDGKFPKDLNRKVHIPLNAYGPYT